MNDAELSQSLRTSLGRGFGVLPDGGDVAYDWDQESDRFSRFEYTLHHPSQYRTGIEELEKHFNENHIVVRNLLHHPEKLLTAIGELQVRDDQRWWVFTCYVEALWSFLHSDASTAPSHRRLLPLAARLRFLALSHPFRFSGHDGWDPNGTFSKLFGKSSDRSTVELARRAHDARDAWREQLDDFQSFVPFNNADPHALEEELRSLAFADQKSSPLRLIDYSHKDAETAPSQDHAVMEAIVERHLLPRFALGLVLRMVRHRHDRADGGPHWSGGLLYGALLLSAMTAIGYAVLASFSGWAIWPGAVGAIVVYLTIGMGTLWYGRLWAMPLMLRLPAASALGLIILIALPSDWWQDADFTVTWIWAWGALLGASFGYLLVECRNHNPGQFTRDPYRALGRLVGRSAAVLTVGVVHSALVALIGLATIIPAFTGDGTQLRELWETGSMSEQLPILLATTLSCLTVGVFSQILWDDQPITAPLAHRRWRSER